MYEVLSFMDPRIETETPDDPEKLHPDLPAVRPPGGPPPGEETQYDLPAVPPPGKSDPEPTTEDMPVVPKESLRTLIP